MPRLPGERRLDPDEDSRLVAGCLAGDAAAWQALVRRHERLVYAVARSYRLSEPDLGDVFQDVFAALVRGLPHIRDTRALCRWLSSTTERIARATALRRRREDALHSPIEARRDLLDADQPAVGAEMEQLEEQAVIRLAVEGLPERCRELLRALYYEDPTPGYAEISRRLGVPMGSLGPTRARCFDRLRKILAAGDVESTGAGISEPVPPTSLGEGSTRSRQQKLPRPASPVKP